jgi:hypothetical protein
VEVNWVHNTQDFGSQLNGVLVKQDGAASIGEMKVGVEGQLSKRFGLWGNVAQQVGDKGYSDTSAMLGVNTASDVTVHRMTGELALLFQDEVHTLVWVSPARKSIDLRAYFADKQGTAS